MIQIYKYKDLGHANHGWLKPYHHFSFANYFNPKRVNFGTLRVINHDTIIAGHGFDMHHHENMEIITYVAKGAITHQDNQGNKGRTEEDNIQIMSAGSGIYHSEYNLEFSETIIFQIWIQPNKLNVKPTWKTTAFPKSDTKNKMILMVSGTHLSPLFIHQNAYIYAGNLEQGTKIKHKLHHQAYIIVPDGKIEIDKRILEQGDGAEITEQNYIEILAIKDSKVLIIDV